MGSARKRRTEDYDPETARFTTQDSYPGQADDPPSLHRYFYANDNPLRYIDPTGHQAVDSSMPADDVVDRKALVDQWARELRQEGPLSGASGGPPQEGAVPIVVAEEDNGPLGNLIMRPLRALGRTTAVQKAGEALRALSDGFDALGKKLGIVAKVVTHEQAGRQDEEALRNKAGAYRAFEGQTGDLASDEIARKHIAVNTGQQFVDTSAEISQKFTEEGARQGVPLVATAAIGKAGRALVGALDAEVGAARAFARTEPVMVAGRRAIDLGKSYEEGIRELYGGGASFSKRVYTAVVDGRTVTGVADNVVAMGGRSVAVEAKYVEEWSTSLRNPANRQPWALAEQKAVMSQAQKYSGAFDQVVYHTNSPELAKYYSKAFEDRGLTNVKFLITPAQK